MFLLLLALPGALFVHGIVISLWKMEVIFGLQRIGQSYYCDT